MIDNSKEYVICVAIWYKDGTKAPRGLIAQNIDSGVVNGFFKIYLLWRANDLFTTKI